MDCYYLYENNSRYRINKIEKINKNTIRMDYNTLIDKKDFKDKVIQLSEKEIEDYKNLIIKTIEPSYDIKKRINDFVSEIELLERNVTDLSRFISVDVKVDDLQETINNLKNELDNIIHPVIEINNTRFKFKCVDDFEKVEE